MLRKTSLNTSLLISVFLVAMVCSITAGEVIHVDVDANLAEYTGPVWCFTTVGVEAQCEYPEDGAVITGDLYGSSVYTELTFIPGATAIKHTGYISTVRDEVANRVEDANLGPPPYGDPLSEFYNETTYYAGIPLSYWEWVRDNYDPYVFIPTAGLEGLIRGQRYYWTVDETDALGNVFPADVWEFAVQDYKASLPNPPNEATFVETDVLLSWVPGIDAEWHYISFGTSLEWDPYPFPIIQPGPWTQPDGDEDWDPIADGGLTIEFNTKYYWRVDEVSHRFPPNPPTIYKGDVWCFTTVPHRIFVDVDATGANDGSSWADAYNYLQDALADAGSAAEPVEIRIAEGIYTPDSNSADPNGSGDRTATFKLIDDVVIKGGYAGFGEANPNARDIELYETILSGDLDGNDVDVNDPCDLRTEPTRDENCYHVVTGSGTDPTAALNGVIVTGGNTDGGYPPICFGGGMYNEYGSPTIINCTFSGNFSHNGGGMYNYSGSSTLTNCIFSNNLAGDGGGMLNDQSNITLINCTFSRNSAIIYAGGGMYDSHSYSTVVNCTFSQNSSKSRGGGMHGAFSEPTLINCILWGNASDRGSQIGMKHDSMVEVSYCNVQGGISGVYLYNSSIDWREGNIDADPCFVDAAGGDLRLSSDSPCIDAGDNSAPNLPATDMYGHPRIIDGDCNETDVVDMGAYEFNYAYIGDFDNDCSVDFVDFSIFGLAWMTKPGDAQWNRFCDISKPSDNYIDWRDAAILCDNWLAEIP